MQEKKKKNKRILVIIGLLLLLFGLIGILLLNKKKAEVYGKYIFDEAAVAGRIQNMSEDEIQDELNRVVAEGMFNISIASSVVYDLEAGEGQARIENILANHYNMQVDIVLDETGETIYSSGLIQPGYAIDKISFDHELEPGEYPATAVFKAITTDDYLLYGSAAAQIRIYVLNGGESMLQQVP